MLRFRIARPARASAEGVCDVRSSLVSESSASSSAERSVSCVLANEGMSVGCGILFCFVLGGFNGRLVGCGGVVYLVCPSITLAHAFYVICKLFMRFLWGASMQFSSTALHCEIGRAHV